MKKFKILSSMVLASFILFGCSEEVKNQKNGLIELQNTNPTISQEHFDAMISKIKSEITNSDFKIYSIENAFNEPYKSKITEETMNKLLSEKAENRLTRDTDLTLATSVFIVSEKDETEFFIYRIACKDKKCNRAMTLQWK